MGVNGAGKKLRKAVDGKVDNVYIINSRRS